MEKTCELVVCREGGALIVRGKRLSGKTDFVRAKAAEIVVREELPVDVEVFCEVNYQRRKLERAARQERLERRRAAKQEAQQRARLFGFLAAVFAGLSIATSFVAPWWAVISPVLLAVGCIKMGGFV